MFSITLDSAIAAFNKSLTLLDKVITQNIERNAEIGDTVRALQDESDKITKEIVRANRIKERLRDLLD